jgi:hypothetical protein
MLALLTAEAAVVGALDLLFVILAVTVLGRSQAWADYLNGAYGVGAVLAGAVTAMLVGRRLGVPILGAAFLLAVPEGCEAFGERAWAPDDELLPAIRSPSPLVPGRAVTSPG